MEQQLPVKNNGDNTPHKNVNSNITGVKDSKASLDQNEHQRQESEDEVKESLQDEDIPVEPVVGNDGIEVGGEG